MMDSNFEVYLSPPYLSGQEPTFLQQSLKSGWIAPHGPQLVEFERQIANICQVPFALAVQSGTAALHLALLMAGVERGDEVLCPTFTFAALPFMVALTGAKPVFIDCQFNDWNVSLPLAEQYLSEASRRGKVPKALILAHNYGVMADAPAFRALCEQFGVSLIEDAAAAFGSYLNDRHAGSFGHFGTLSFNGNKLITTGGGGGMLLLQSSTQYEKALKLSLQAKEASIAYEHHTMGFNYRMSNLSAAFGLAQLMDLQWRINRKKEIHSFYRQELGNLVTFQEPKYKGSTPWLTTIDMQTQWEPIFEALKTKRIECRPLWKPLHLQKAFVGATTIGGVVAEALFATGLCLPSGLQIIEQQQMQVCEAIKTNISR